MQLTISSEQSIWHWNALIVSDFTECILFMLFISTTINVQEVINQWWRTILFKYNTSPLNACKHNGIDGKNRDLLHLHLITRHEYGSRSGQLLHFQAFQCSQETFQRHSSDDFFRETIQLVKNELKLMLNRSVCLSLFTHSLSCEHAQTHTHEEWSSLECSCEFERMVKQNRNSKKIRACIPNY